MKQKLAIACLVIFVALSVLAVLLLGLERIQ